MMPERPVAFLERPEVGKRVLIVLDSQTARTSSIVRVWKDPRQENAYAVRTKSGSIYRGLYDERRATFVPQKQIGAEKHSEVHNVHSVLAGVLKDCAFISIIDCEVMANSVVVRLQLSKEEEYPTGTITVERARDVRESVKNVVVDMFDCADFAHELIISVYFESRKPTGHPTNACCVSVRADRDKFNQLLPSGLGGEEFLRHFLFREGFGRKNRIVGVQPYVCGAIALDIASLSDISPEEFERRIGGLLEHFGFAVDFTSHTADGGIDVIATSPKPIIGGKIIVQCKRYGEGNKVGEPAVRDLFGVVSHERANKGVLVTTSDFTAAAHRFAEGKPIELINGETLQLLLASLVRT